MALVRIIGFAAAAVLLSYGVWFQVDSDAALSVTYHSYETLPAVMGGRYFFFGAMLIAALLYEDTKVLAVLLAGFGGLGLFDAILYMSTTPLPHLAVGVLALVASFYFFQQRKTAS